jgi:hypothetical protein
MVMLADYYLHFRLISFAYLEMSLILAKLLFSYDMELVDKRLDWEGQSQVHVQWWKPELRMRFVERNSS